MYFSSNNFGSSVAGTSFGLGLAAVIISIILTILLVVLVVPEKRRAGLPKFFQVVHDICNFKGLLDFFLKRFSRFSTSSQQSMLCSQAFLLGSQADITLA